VKAVLAALLLLAPAAPTPLFHLADPRLDEISGIAAGIASPGVVYVQNDSGDPARFFALDERTGALLAEYDVPGARNVDWEDIAVARDAAGTPSVWLADIGDNRGTRREIEVYRVDEPHVDTRRRDLGLTTAAPQVWRLSYQDGPHDAESLAVSPAGVPYVVTKSPLGGSAVYAAGSRPGTHRLTAVGAIRFLPTGTGNPFGIAGQLAATGADWSGDRFVVRTYSDAYFWTVPGGDLRAALRQRPQRVALPRQPQGEGICFAGGRVLVDSEGVGSAVYAVREPTPPAAPATGSTTQAAPEPTAAAIPARRTGRSTAWWLAGGAAAAALALAAVVVVTLRRWGSARR
jgi:hypothetical protein